MALCIELLQVMLEESSTESATLAQGISEDLDVLMLLEAMINIMSYIMVSL